MELDEYFIGPLEWAVVYRLADHAASKASLSYEEDLRAKHKTMQF